MKNLFSKFKNKNSENIKNEVPLKIDNPHRYPIKHVDYLSDEDLIELNNILDWNSFLLDTNGRRFGNVAWSGKRTEPQIIPDPRHLTLNNLINLSDKHVLEIGCFEGIHTIGLCQFAKKVTAIDSRIENIVKTIVRASLFGYHPTVFKSDVENWRLQFDTLRSDVCHHIGVLYHLKDPVTHLLEVGEITKDALLLDTHIAEDNEATETYQVKGQSYAYKKYLEGKDVFSGMYDHAKWLTLHDLTEVLKSAGFKTVELLEKRAERNGPRILLFAKK